MEAPRTRNNSRFVEPVWIGLALAISYVDRQTLPVAIRAIQNDIPISNSQFSQLQAAFLGAYAVGYVAGGRMIDAIGGRLAFVVMMVAWSFACAGQSLATGFTGLAVARMLLGLGEGGGFPAATKLVAEGFSARERSTAMGIVHAGTSLGAVLAPPLVAAVVLWTSWRWAFGILGATGLLWVAGWLRVAPRIRSRSSVETGEWISLLSSRALWGIFAAKFLYDAAFYFYLFWLPKYLIDARGFDIKRVGYYAWIPYAAHGVGGLLGGKVSSLLLSRGYSLNLARKAVIGVSAALTPVVFFVTSSPAELAIVLLSIAYFAQAATSALLMVLPADLFPLRQVATVAGVIGVGGTLGGMLFGFVVGYLLDHGSGYSAVFALVSVLHLVAFGILLATTGKLEGKESGAAAVIR